MNRTDHKNFSHLLNRSYMPVIPAMEIIFKKKFPAKTAVVKQRLVKTYIEVLLSDEATTHRKTRKNAFSKVVLKTSPMAKMLNQWD